MIYSIVTVLLDPGDPTYLLSPSSCPVFLYCRMQPILPPCSRHLGGTFDKPGLLQYKHANNGQFPGETGLLNDERHVDLEGWLVQNCCAARCPS